MCPLKLFWVPAGQPKGVIMMIPIFFPQEAVAQPTAYDTEEAQYQQQPSAPVRPRPPVRRQQKRNDLRTLLRLFYLPELKLLQLFGVNTDNFFG